MSKAKPLDARTLRAVARNMSKRALGVDHSTDPYCIGMACAYRIAARHCNSEALAIETKGPQVTVFPIAAQVEVLERRLANAEAKLAKMLSFGSQLANCAHNLKQQERLSEHDRKCLHAAQTGWDEARRMP